MHYVLPDPNPGRCRNMRDGHRCLDYDIVVHVCTFPEVVAGLDTVVSATGWSGYPTPIAWIKPEEAAHAVTV